MRHLPADKPRVPLAPLPTGGEASSRHHELDWLRAFVILALVPSHAAGFYTANTARYLGTQYASPIGLSTLMSLGSWGIALLFLVAGAAAQNMLARHTAREFIGERCVRLFIPLVFASLTLIPLQDFLMVHAFPALLTTISAPPGWDPKLANSPVAFYLWYAGAYIAFLLHYAPQYTFIFWSHLWFIPYLLVISLLTLPLLRSPRILRRSRLVARLADVCDRHRGAVFLLALPLGLTNIVLGWQWQGWQIVGAPDAANLLAQFVFYALVYVYGFVLYSDERMRRAVRRDGNVGALAVALVVFVVTQLPGMGDQALAHDFSAGGVVSAMLRAVALWVGIVAIVGLSMRFLGFTSRLGQYLTEASYPFYVLHLAVLYLVGIPLLASGVPGVLGFLTMVGLTYVITLAAFELLIRPIGPMRALFGMRSRHPPATGRPIWVKHGDGQ